MTTPPGTWDGAEPRAKRGPFDHGVPGSKRLLMGAASKDRKSRILDSLFSHVDMPPTLLALAGFDVPKRMQGADLSTVALGKTTKGPDAVLLEIFVPFNPDQIHTPWRGIITDR